MLTFEQIPDAIGRLFEKLDNIERMIKANGAPSTTTPDLMVITEAAEFLHLALPTIYGLVSNRKIPFMKKGKRLYFSKKELSAWLASTRREVFA